MHEQHKLRKCDITVATVDIIALFIEKKGYTTTLSKVFEQRKKLLEEKDIVIRELGLVRERSNIEYLLGDFEEIVDEYASWFIGETVLCAKVQQAHYKYVMTSVE